MAGEIKMTSIMRLMSPVGLSQGTSTWIPPLSTHTVLAPLAIVVLLMNRPTQSLLLLQHQRLVMQAAAAAAVYSTAVVVM